MSTGAWLKQARKDAGISCEKAASRVRAELENGLVGTTVWRMEQYSDETLAEEPEVVAALAVAYGKSPDDIPPGEVLDAHRARQAFYGRFTASAFADLGVTGSRWSPQLAGRAA